MARYVALLRAVNVAGHARIPTDELARMFAAAGARDVLVLSGSKPSGFYGFPNSFVEAAFGIPATTRNWSTVARLAKLL